MFVYTTCAFASRLYENTAHIKDTYISLHSGRLLALCVNCFASSISIIFFSSNVMIGNKKTKLFVKQLSTNGNIFWHHMKMLIFSYVNSLFVYFQFQNHFLCGFLILIKFFLIKCRILSCSETFFNCTNIHSSFDWKSIASFFLLSWHIIFVNID